MNGDQSSPVKWYGILSRNDGIPKHCARCHKNYTIVHTGGTPHCSIPHVFRPEPAESDNVSPGQRRFDSECCGPSVCVFEVNKGSGKCDVWQEGGAFCFLGDHTMDEDKASQDYNGVNILPCLMKEGQCCREWLRGLEENENIVWSSDYNRQQKAREK
jgi:hypothetical protein